MRYRVKLTLYAAGPIRERTKYKEPRLLMGEACISLPFVPYPGLYLTMEKPRRRGEPHTLYLRIRTVEWELRRNAFRCMVDEMLGSNLIDETFEVRGSPRIEKHFHELEQTLRIFGFDVETGITAPLATDKYPDGSWIVPPAHMMPMAASEPTSPRRRRFGW